MEQHQNQEQQHQWNSSSNGAPGTAAAMEHQEQHQNQEQQQQWNSSSNGAPGTAPGTAAATATRTNPQKVSNN